MPLYKYFYLDDSGEIVIDEVGASNISQAVRTVRIRMKERRELVMWDVDDPPPHVEAWLRDMRGKY